MTLEPYLQELVQEDGKPTHSLLINLSGLDSEEMEQFSRWWPANPAERRRELLDTLLSVVEDNVDLDFNSIFRYCLTDTAPEVRERAIAGLWECDERNILGPLLSLLQEDPNEQVRASAAAALGKFSLLAETGKLLPRDADRIREALLEAVENAAETTDVRRRALEAVACFSTVRVPELVRWAYQSQEPKLRLSALYAMGRTCDPVWLSILISETENGDPAMRFEAVSAFAEIGDEESIHYLIPLIEDEDTQVQLSAIRSIGAIGGPLAERALKRCLKHDDEPVQEAAQEALDQLDAETDPLGFMAQRRRP
jgi:HEAT repeat protein